MLHYMISYYSIFDYSVITTAATQTGASFRPSKGRLALPRRIHGQGVGGSAATAAAALLQQRRAIRLGEIHINVNNSKTSFADKF